MDFEKEIAVRKQRILENIENEDEKSSYTETVFESIRHENEYGQEFWYARELQQALEYGKWDNFKRVIEKAKISCSGSNIPISDHFADVGKMVYIGSNTEREIQDIELSRYACYLIVMNADPRKEIVSLGQTYFAVKTRQQELIENFDELNENQKRISIRNEMKIHNKSLAEAAQMSGIKEPRDYAIFQNCGYKGLYGGLNRKDIHQRKGLKKSKHPDYMGSTELAANLFRATQTDEKLRNEKVQGKIAANKVHYDVGAKVRQTIKELGGTMPEDLPTPEKSIKQLEREIKNIEKEK